eukprot:COSAG06_NODE_67472_length_252_cov_0.339869_1_plen_33_part_10
MGWVWVCLGGVGVGRRVGWVEVGWGGVGVWWGG